MPPEVAARLRITVVPAYVQVANRSYRDVPSEGVPSEGVPSEGVPSEGFSRKEFYAQLPAMSSMPTTAVPPAHEFTSAYRSLTDEADEVIAIVVSASLSGMYNVAHLGAQDAPELKVHVVDSGQISMGLGWMVVAAAEAAAEGQSAQEILALVEDIKSRVRVYAMLDTLEYMRRSGRVSWARAKAAQILRIKPIVEVLLGKVHNVGQVRTRRRAIERLVELVRAHAPLERLAILHTYAPEVDDLCERLIDLCPSMQTFTVAVTTIIGAHVGPRGLGVAVVTAG